MTKTHYLFLLFFLIPFLGKAQNWKPLGPDDFNQPSTGRVETASISNGTDHIFVASVYGNNKITIKKFETGKWQTISDVAFSENNTGYAKVVFSGTTPYVAYKDASNNSKLTVKKYNGTSWELVGAAGISGDNLQSLDLAFNGTTPYVLYTDAASNRKIIVKQYNGTNWVTIGSNDVSNIYAGNPGLALDGATPYVVYKDDSNSGKMTVKKYDGNNWVALGDIGISNVEFSDLVINSGTPYVMYSGWSNNDKLTVQKFNGTNWAPVGTDVFNDRITGAKISFDGITPYVIYKTDNSMNSKTVVKKLNADASGWETVGDLGLLQGNSMGGGPDAVDPMVISFVNAITFAFYLEGDYDKKVIVKQFNGTDWESLGGSGISAGRAGLLSVASDGIFPYIAYQDWANSSKATVKKYNGASWETVGTAGFSSGSVGVTPAIAIHQSTPYIAFTDNGRGSKLHVNYYHNNAWQSLGAEVSLGSCSDFDIALNNEQAYVAYTDQVNGYRISVKKFNRDSDVWELVGNADISNGSVTYVSIAFLEDIPYVAYNDGTAQNKITIKKLNGTVWETVGNTNFSGNWSSYANLVVNKNQLYIAFTDGGDQQIKVHQYNDSDNNWELLGVPVSTGYRPKLSFDNDVAYVAFQDAGNGYKLAVKKFNGTNWEAVGDANVSADRISSVGLSLANNKLVVAYALESGPAYAKSYLLPFPAVVSNSTVYVTENGAGTKDGSSWANATADLQQAIQQSTENVYVAAGTYKPIYPANTDFSGTYTPNEGNRDNAFVLVKDVKVYGGFNATNPEASPALRDTSATSINKSILSGDLIGNDPNEIDPSTETGMINFEDNSVHVVVSVGDVGTALLNGFEITGGFALREDAIGENAEDPFTTGITVNGVIAPNLFGGGILAVASNPTLKNLVLTKNIALGGAGVAVMEGNPILTNSSMSGNLAMIGGGMLNFMSGNSILTNVSINKNLQGGGMANLASSPILTNVTILGDANNANGIVNEGSSNPQIRNSIIEGITNSSDSAPIISYSLIKGSGGSNNWVSETGTDGGHNIDADALFTDATHGDLTLQAGSPAINAGSNSFFANGQTPDLSGITFDLAGNSRFNGTVDMGAYEYQGTLPVNLVDFTAKAETAGARLQWQTASEQSNKYFTISRSTDGVNFTTLGTINSKGESNNATNYSFLDQSPANGTNYYLLQQTDTDGKSSDLGIRTVLFQVAGVELAVYPNPTVDVANLKFATGVFNNTELMDLSGRILERQFIKADQSETSFNLSSYKSGTYIIRLKGQKNEELRKIIKF